MKLLLENERVMSFANKIVDKYIKCEYHDYEGGYCTACGRPQPGHKIAIIGKNEEDVKALGETILRISKRKKNERAV